MRGGHRHTELSYSRSHNGIYVSEFLVQILHARSFTTTCPSCVFDCVSWTTTSCRVVSCRVVSCRGWWLAGWRILCPRERPGEKSEIEFPISTTFWIEDEEEQEEGDLIMFIFSTSNTSMHRRHKQVLDALLLSSVVDCNEHNLLTLFDPEMNNDSHRRLGCIIDHVGTIESISSIRGDRCFVYGFFFLNHT